MRIREKIILLILCLAVLLVSSCEMFTHSMFKGAARDLSETMKNVSTSDLISSGSDSGVISNPGAAKAALEELGARKEELKNISVEQAEEVLNLGTAAILPTEKLMDAVDKLMNPSTDTGTGSGENTENSNNATTDFLSTIMGTVKDIPEIKTEALETVLSNKEVVESGDLSTVALATVSLAASALRNENLETEEAYQTVVTTITDNINRITEGNKATEGSEGTDWSKIKPEEFIDGVLAGTDLSDSSAMKTAMEALYYLMQREDLGSLFGSGSDENPEGTNE